MYERYFATAATILSNRPTCKSGQIHSLASPPNCRMIFGKLCVVAIVKAVLPCLSRSLTRAPRWSSTSTISRFPYSAADIKGVRPGLELVEFTAKEIDPAADDL